MASTSKATKECRYRSCFETRKTTKDRLWDTRVNQFLANVKNLPYQQCICLMHLSDTELMEELVDAGVAIHQDMFSMGMIHALDSRLAKIKAERRSEEASERWTAGQEDGQGCFMCRDCLDEIFEGGRSLHAAQCGHLFCSDCLLQIGKKIKCPSCKKVVTGVRRLYVV